MVKILVGGSCLFDREIEQYGRLGSWLRENAVAFKTERTNFLRNAIRVIRIYQRGRFLIDLRKSILPVFRLAGFHAARVKSAGSRPSVMRPVFLR
jgi:hypothetical protein